MEAKHTSSFELFPMAAERAAAPQKPETPEKSSDAEALDDLEATDIVSWSVDDVQTWLRLSGLEEVGPEFAVGRVDGKVLARIDEDFLREQVEIRSALTRRKCLRSLHGLRRKQVELFKEKTVEQKDDFVTKVESHRLHLVSKLKTIFDKFAEQGDRGGEDRMNGSQLEQALLYMDRPVDSAQVNDWLTELKSNSAGITFSEFVSGYSALFGGTTFEIKSSDVSPPKKTAKKPKYDLEDFARWDRDSIEEQEKVDEASKSTFFDAVDVEDLTELKIVFDRFSVDQKITPTEACQALTEAGVVTPRRQMAKYLRSRHHVLMDRSIDFYEFIKAYATLRNDSPFSAKRTYAKESKRDVIYRSYSCREETDLADSGDICQQESRGSRSPS